MPAGGPVYDGFVVHRYAGLGRINQCAAAPAAGDPRQITKNAGVPVIRIVAQTDVLGTFQRRRPDSDEPADRYRLYEVAGAPHADAYFYRHIPSVKDQAAAGTAAFVAQWPFAEVCTPPIPLMEFPVMRYVVNAAFANLDRWVRDGTPAPRAERVAVKNGGTPQAAIATDEFGNAIGGVRSPYLDVPTATYYASTPGPGTCGNLGHKDAFSLGAPRERLRRVREVHLEIQSGRRSSRSGAVVDRIRWAKDQSRRIVAQDGLDVGQSHPASSRVIMGRSLSLGVDMLDRQAESRRNALSRTAGPASIVMLVVASLGASACSAHYVRSAPGGAFRPSPPEASITRNVLVISVDGLRPDAIAAYRTPTLQRLMREGSYTLSASTIFPSKTLPSHTSMLTGQPPETHGVLWNTVATADTDSIELPNIFSVARAHGYSTAAFFSKAKFQPLQRLGTLDYSQAPGGWFGRWSGERTVNDVSAYLEGARPNLLFVHLSDPDAAGHGAGWMSAEYGRAVIATDATVDRLIGLAEGVYGSGNFSLILTADHGGHGRNHGSGDPRDVTIPWIAWGQGVKQGALESSSIRTMDTAATVLWLLGLAKPVDWTGEAVIQAYEPHTAQPAFALD